jgi:hypothetical protein
MEEVVKSRTNVKKFHVEIAVEISDQCMERTDNGVFDPEDFVRAELGWASESFDGMEIIKLKLLDQSEKEHSSLPSVTIAILISSNPADHCDPVIERAVFAGPQETINDAVRDQLISWAENYFDLDERQMKDFRDDPDYCSSDSECTGDYRVIVEHDCRFVNLSTEDGGENA